ncbi:hypothetical protein DMUE_3415 [Dictyocoela muelleri]|nr:hypothetical protein DMUE_3415 [Dictyocoela muelleri]
MNLEKNENHTTEIKIEIESFTRWIKFYESKRKLGKIKLCHPLEKEENLNERMQEVQEVQEDLNRDIDELKLLILAIDMSNDSICCSINKKQNQITPVINTRQSLYLRKTSCLIRDIINFDKDEIDSFSLKRY